MSFLKNIFGLAFLALALSTNLTSAYAGVIPTPGEDRLTQSYVCGGGQANVNVDCYNETFLKKFSERFFSFAGYIAAIAVIIIIVAGIQYAAARGDLKKIATAKTMIFQSMLAIILVVASYTIITLLWSLASSVGNSVSNGTTSVLGNPKP